MNKNKVYTHVSLFSGAGGLDIGLEQAGFHTVWANDFNHDACETHRLWSNATVVEGDIGKVDYDTIPDCDIASFGFPCQGFSLSGPRKIDDSRNVLYRHCVKPFDVWLDAIGPDGKKIPYRVKRGTIWRLEWCGGEQGFKELSGPDKMHITLPDEYIEQHFKKV